MKITKIDVMMLHANKPPQKKAAGGGIDWSNVQWRPIVCRVHTDEGLYGDGEAAMAYGAAAPGAFGMLRELSGMVIGMDPMKNELVWETLYKRSYWGQNGGPVFFSAMSAIDMALWDIRGKALGVPLHVLLGGKRRDSLRTYASQLQLGWGSPHSPAFTPEAYAANAKLAVADGYDAVKINFFNFDCDGSPLCEEQRTRLLKPYYLNLIEERVAAVREAIGPNVDLMIENNGFPDAQTAIQIASRVEKYNIFFFEEPCTPNPKTAKYVEERINIPIAIGERIYTRWQYIPYFESQAMQIIQPDLGNGGGITELKKIADMAHAYDIAVQVHVCGTPLCAAAAIQLESVIPNFAIHEHIVFNLQQYNKDFCIHDYQPRNGQTAVPDIPGNGNELSEYALSHCDKVTVGD